MADDLYRCEAIGKAVTAAGRTRGFLLRFVFQVTFLPPCRWQVSEPLFTEIHLWSGNVLSELQRQNVLRSIYHDKERNNSKQFSRLAVLQLFVLYLLPSPFCFLWLLGTVFPCPCLPWLEYFIPRPPLALAFKTGFVIGTDWQHLQK